MERPIILKAHEVRGILDGRQTQLRRILKHKNQLPPDWVAHIGDTGGIDWELRPCKAGMFWGSEAEQNPPRPLRRWPENDFGRYAFPCPFGRVGDRLWGREAFYDDGFTEDMEPIYVYRSDYADPSGVPWQSSSQMPKHIARIMLEIVSVRVERLQDISDADAMAEGCKAVRNHCHVFEGSGYDKAGLCHGTPKIAFGCRWDEIHGSDSWTANPWVWVVEFKRVDAA